MIFFHCYNKANKDQDKAVFQKKIHNWDFYCQIKTQVAQNKSENQVEESLSGLVGDWIIFLTKEKAENAHH